MCDYRRGFEMDIEFIDHLHVVIKIIYKLSIFLHFTKSC
jgi:hypothetical protein